MDSEGYRKRDGEVGVDGRRVDIMTGTPWNLPLSLVRTGQGTLPPPTLAVERLRPPREEVGLVVL